MDSFLRLTADDFPNATCISPRVHCTSPFRVYSGLLARAIVSVVAALLPTTGSGEEPLERIRAGVRSYDSRIATLSGKYEWTVKPERWWVELMVGDGGGKLKVSGNGSWTEDRLTGRIRLDSTDILEDGGRYRTIVAFDGKATALFSFPKGDELYSVKKVADMSRDVRWFARPSSFAGLRIAVVSRSLAALLGDSTIAYKGQEQASGHLCDRVTLRFLHERGEASIQALLDPQNMYLPMELELSRDRKGTTEVQWRSRITSVQQVEDPVTGDPVPYPGRVTLLNSFGGRLAESMEFTLSDLRINAAIPEESFSTDLVSLPAGTVVDDSSKQPPGTYVVGGRHDLMDSRVQRIFPERDHKPGSPVRAEVRSVAKFYYALGAVVSVGLIALGVYLRKRNA